MTYMLKPDLPRPPSDAARVALFEKPKCSCCFWLLAREGSELKSAVERAARPTVEFERLNESCADETEAERRFDELTRAAARHGWAAFYVGPPLEG